MKKLTSIILSLLILSLPLCVAAEADEPFEFIFRNGIKWGDPRHVVSSSEPSSSDRSENNGFQFLNYADIDVSQYTGQLTYCFVDDALLACMYVLQPDALDYMSGALAAKYGDPIETDETRATALLTAFGPIEGTTFHSMWDLPDDTCITLFSVAGEDTLYLLYADEPALLEHANTNYNLNGL